MINQLSKFFSFSCFLILLASCANQSAPTGGPQDKTAPKIVKDKSYPTNNTLNFTGRIVEITFDEDITAQTLQEQLLITPVEENNFRIIPRRNKIRLQFEKDFSPNTTYTFNFREGIRDITENNIMEDRILSFSTGSYIDSISTKGSVNDALTNTPLKDVLVSLYKAGDTLNPLNSKPMYFALTTADGTFNIQNIKNGTYDIYALDDKNKNLKYEETERIDFIKKTDLTKSLNDLKFQIAKIDTSAPKILLSRSVEGVVEIQFNEGIAQATLQGENKNDLIYNIHPTGKSIIVYDIFNKTDSIPVTVQATDTTGNTITKAIKIAFKDDKDTKKPTLSMNFLPEERELNPKKYSLTIQFNRPLTKYLLNQLTLLEDNQKQTIRPDAFDWINKTTLKITKETKAKDTVTLIIPAKTFSFLDLENKADTVIYTLKKDENVGSISGTIQTEKKNYVIELLDFNYKVVEKLVNPTTFNFTYLDPGSYYLRAIEDENKNGKWDSGNLQAGKQAEKIYLLKDKIDLRANWEVEGIFFKF